MDAFDKYSSPNTWSEDKSSMKFSLIFPSRDRQELLNTLLKSIENNTHNLRDVEVLIAIDTDDTATQNFMATQWKRSWVKSHCFERSLNFSRDYYNRLATASTGRWIIAVNDDCVFETPNWDAIAYEVLKDKPEVIYGWMEDGLGNFRAKGHGNYCCFPLQGRKGVEALGFFFPSRIPTWGADIWAKGLYDQVGSVVEIPIKLMHYNYHNKTRPQDDISRRIQSNQVPMDVRPAYDEINRLLAALKNEMVKS